MGWKGANGAKKMEGAVLLLKGRFCVDWGFECTAGSSLPLRHKSVPRRALVVWCEHGDHV